MRPEAPRTLYSWRVSRRTWSRLAPPRQAHLDGFDLHADVSAPAGTRARLEHLRRYLLRPPTAQERLGRDASLRLRERPGILGTIFEWTPWVVGCRPSASSAATRHRACATPPPQSSPRATAEGAGASV